MDSRRRARIVQGVVDAPPPPLAGALGAWFDRQDVEIRVVDPRGSAADWSGDGPLWIHLEPGFDPARVAAIPGSGSVHFFGAGARELLSSGSGIAGRFEDVSIIQGDPEPTDDRIADLDSLPITTYAGFGPQPGGLFRVLAGRGDRVRSPAHLLREVVYLVETFGAGHLVFDDDDLAAWPGWLEQFGEELAHLPWEVTWEGRVDGEIVRQLG